MKIKDGYIIKSVAGSNVIVPISNPRFESIITVNDTGMFIFELLQKEDLNASAIVEKLCQEYEINKEIAANDCQTFIAELKRVGLINE